MFNTHSYQVKDDMDFTEMSFLMKLIWGFTALTFVLTVILVLPLIKMKP